MGFTLLSILFIILAVLCLISVFLNGQPISDSLISGLKGQGVKIFGKGRMDMDLTQTSYSTIPSVDIELGDKVSDHGEKTLNNLADGLVKGVNIYYGFSS